MTIHKEGHRMLIILFIIIIALNLSLCYFTHEFTTLRYTVIGCSSLLFLVVLQFFRSPKRIYHPNENQILAPADGKIVVIEEVEEPEYFKGKRKQISVFMSPINVHINRNPISGVVK